MYRWALRVAKSLRKGTCLCFLPDSGSRYLSKVYNDGWMREHGYVEAEVTLTAGGRESG